MTKIACFLTFCILGAFATGCASQPVSAPEATTTTTTVSSVTTEATTTTTIETTTTESKVSKLLRKRKLVEDRLTLLEGMLNSNENAEAQSLSEEEMAQLRNMIAIETSALVTYLEAIDRKINAEGV